jgi:hypothetical protein
MDTLGLRERKKQRTRQLIADTAARLFAERGYEHVAVSDVARAAEVSEPTAGDLAAWPELGQRSFLDAAESEAPGMSRC